MNRRAFALGTIMVLLGSFIAIALRSFAEAAFLAAYGPRHMPWLLIANAGGFAVATLGYDVLTRIARARTVDLVLLGALALTAGAAPTLLALDTPPVAIVTTLAAASQVAGLALWNRVCAAVAGRDARRYLPRAGAAVTLGGAIAGLGAAAVIPRVGLAAIPYAGAVVTVIVLAVCIAQERALVRGGAPGGAQASSATAVALAPLQRSLVLAMIVVAALEGVVTTVIDLQFISLVKATFTGEDVAVALSLFYGGTNALLFVLQSAAVPHVLVTRAMTFTTAIHPAIVVLSYAGFAVAPSFVGIAATRTADQVLRFATSRTSQELELSALPPAPRGRWKVLLRGVVWPAGAALAALVLLLVGPAALRNPPRLAGVAILVAVAWGIAARIAARRFQAALAAPLGIRASRREDPRRIDLETLERWTQVAGSGDPRTAALARAALAHARVHATDLADHLRHDDPAVRAALFDQLARAPAPALRGELRTAIAIEEDDRALAMGIKALAIAGDEAGIERGKERAGLDRDVDRTVASATVMLRGGDCVTEVTQLLASDPMWACELIRRRPDAFASDVLEGLLHAAASREASRAGALLAIARLGPPANLPLLARALEEGDAAATLAIEHLDADGCVRLAAGLPVFSPLARGALARGLAAVPAAGALVATLASDADPEVAYAGLRSALAIARGGGALPAERIIAAHDAALAALAAHLDARDAIASPAVTCSAAVRTELEVATRRCAARVLWATAVEAAVSSRDPAPIAASARHLLGSRDADRKRALDVVQELQARPALLALLERWLLPARPVATSLDEVGLATYDPWLGQLVAGELGRIEPVLNDLRRASLFASIAGPALAALAERATRVHVTTRLFAEGDSGDTMFVVTRGTFGARRGEQPERPIGAGEVVGELAVLTHAPRAATLTARGPAEVLAIDRAAFAEATRRAPELVLDLSATLAGWLAPQRPDVL